MTTFLSLVTYSDPLLSTQPSNRYSCPDFTKLDPSKCHFKDKVIADQGALPDDLINDLCRPGCRCNKSPDSEYATFTCSHYDCPEYFGRQEPDCLRQHSLDSCCSNGETCGTERSKLEKCYVDGQEYHEKQKIYPNGYPCLKCLCQKNFMNHTFADNTACKEINCGFNLEIDKLKQGCVPEFYGEKTCCAIDWRCRKSLKPSLYWPESYFRINFPAEDSDSVVKKSESDSKETCLFGKLVLNLGDELNVHKKGVVCKCSLPPFVHCVGKE